MTVLRKIANAWVNIVAIDNESWENQLARAILFVAEKTGKDPSEVMARVLNRAADTQDESAAFRV